MTRHALIAGNWKMNTDRAGAVALAAGVAALPVPAGREVLVIPPTCLLDLVVSAVSGTHVRVGAQNMHPADGGAFTGETSGSMLTSLGVGYVLCGHSERRHVFGEASSFVGEKVKAAHQHGIRPILCVGETLDDREGGRTESVVGEQLGAGLAAVDAAQMLTTTIAYEPVWAIGTGRTATPAQAQAVHAYIRLRLAARYGEATAEAVRIQYGGSVKPGNAAELLGQPDIDGALVGGASLSADSFGGIIAAGGEA